MVRTMVIRNQSERCRFELRSAPWTLFKGNRGGLPVIVSKPDGPRPSGIWICVANLAHAIRRRGPAHPEPDLERPVAELDGIRLALQFQRTDQRRSPAQLFEGQEAQ